MSFIKLPEKGISLLEKNEVLEEKRGLGTREHIFVLLGEAPGTGMEYYISKTMENQIGLEIVKTTDDMHLGSAHKIGKILHNFLKEEVGSTIFLTIAEIEPIDIEEPKTSNQTEYQNLSSLRERQQRTKIMNTYHRGTQQSGHRKPYINRRLYK